jgi:hypothetical protein
MGNYKLKDLIALLGRKSVNLFGSEAHDPHNEFSLLLSIGNWKGGGLGSRGGSTHYFLKESEYY